MRQRSNCIRLAGHHRIGYRGLPAVRPASIFTGGQTARAARPKVNGARLRPIPHGKRPSARDGDRSGCLRCTRLCGRLGRSSFRRGTPTVGSGLFLGCFFLSRLFSRLFFGCLLCAGACASPGPSLYLSCLYLLARRRFRGRLACRAPGCAFLLRRNLSACLTRFRHAPLLCACRPFQ